MAPRKTPPEPVFVLTDNVAKGGVFYPKGTPVAELPESLQRTVMANEALVTDLAAEDDD